jgi:hypothetical protein
MIRLIGSLSLRSISIVSGYDGLVCQHVFRQGLHRGLNRSLDMFRLGLINSWFSSAPKSSATIASPSAAGALDFASAIMFLLLAGLSLRFAGGCARDCSRAGSGHLSNQI